MKLFVVLSVIACGYAAKLDRTYLPPSSAATAGGSPGALNAPAGPGSPGSSGFGHPSGHSGFGQPSGLGPSDGAGFGKSASAPAFGSQQSGSTGFRPTEYGQPGASAGGLDTGFSQPAQNFGNVAQDYQRNQPQRAQASADQSAQILRLDNQNDGETFSYSFETSNGIAAEESGVATNGVQAQGAYSYSDDEGQNFRVTYTADENGYQPQGEHLPTPHPIPEDILKSIEQNAQAAAAGTQEGAYNPNEDNDDSAPQQYSNNAPTSYGQGPSGASSYNKPQGGRPSQLYGAPAAAVASSRPQSDDLAFQPLSPQQYSAPDTGALPSRPSNGFSQPQGPSQAYGSPSNGATQARPISFGQNQFPSQGPSQQYGAPSRPGASAGPTSNGFAPSGPATTQYSAPSQSGFLSGGRPQRPISAQAQDDSGYQYDKPQGSSGRISSQGPTDQYRPQNGASPTGSQGSFLRPMANNVGYPSGPAKGPFGPSSSPSSQGSFGPATGPNVGLSTGSRGPSSFGPSVGPTGTSSFGPSSGPKGSGSYGPSSGSQGQSSFGPFSGSNGFAKQSSPSGTRSSMPESGYSYNRPGSQPGAGSQQPQRGSSGSSGPGQFGGARQPPSFSEEEGYKY